MCEVTHSDDCQLRRYDEEFDRIDEGAEDLEMEIYLLPWAEKSGMIRNDKGRYDYCTCGAVTT